MKIIILLPAYNEEKSILKLVPKIDKVLKNENFDYRIIICNDGSNDGTADVINNFIKIYPITLINHIINRGLGETSRDNFEKAAAISKNEDIIIRMDADNTHEPKYMINMINKIKEGFDVVIASRFVRKKSQIGVSGYRNFISMGANFFMKIFFPIKYVKDYSWGYRAYSAEIIKKSISIYGHSFIQLKGLGFTCTLEKLIKLNLLGAKITEIPFILRYDKKQGKSKMIGSITTLGYIIMVIMHYWPFGGWLYSSKRINKRVDS